MNTINADDVRIPRRVRDALARHEEVVVLNRDRRPVYVLCNPDDRMGASKPLRNGRALREALAILATAPLPDDLFGRDLHAVRESVGSMPADPWAPS